MEIGSRRVAPLLIALAASVVAIAAAALVGDDPAAQSQLAARWTARASFLIFLIAYSAGALGTLFPSSLTALILRRRRQWGLGFALSHAIHLGALIHFLTLTGQAPSPVSLIGGGFGYVVIAAMAATSNAAGQRALGRWWKRLHVFGVHYIWFVFFFSYAGRIADPARMTTGLVFATLAAGALGLRLIALVRKRQTKRAAVA